MNLWKLTWSFNKSWHDHSDNVSTGLREILLESDDHMCPSCKETNVSPDKIVPNRSMRLAVTNFLNDTGYTKVFVMLYSCWILINCVIVGYFIVG